MRSALPGVAAALMQSTTVRFFHEHVLVKEPGTTEVTPWQSRPAVLLRRRRPEREHVDLPRSGPRLCRRRVPVGVASLGPQLRAAQVRRQYGLCHLPRAASSSCPTSTPSATGTASSASTCSPATSSRSTTASCTPAPGTAGLTPYRRHAVSMRYLGDDAVRAAAALAALATVRTARPRRRTAARRPAFRSSTSHPQVDAL